MPDLSSKSPVFNSFVQLPASAAHCRNLKGEELRVLIAVASEYRGPWAPERRVSIGLRKLADKTGIDRHHVRRATRKLEAAGLLRIEAIRAPHGGFDSTVYVLLGGVAVFGDRGVATDGDRVSPYLATGVSAVFGPSTE
jgi:Bacterial regulatory proteins, gntR family